MDGLTNGLTINAFRKITKTTIEIYIYGIEGSKSQPQLEIKAVFLV